MADKVTLTDSTTGEIVYPQTLVDQVQDANGTILSNLVLMKNNTTAFTPTANYHPATKRYVDEKISGGASIVGTTSASIICIGATEPASGTTSLIWVDTSNGGYLKYRISPTAAWTAVPVAYT